MPAGVSKFLTNSGRHERHARQSDASLEALAACVLSGSYVGERTTIRRRVHSSTKFRTAFARARLAPTGAIFVGKRSAQSGSAWLLSSPIRGNLQALRPDAGVPSCRCPAQQKGVPCQKPPFGARDLDAALPR